MLLCISVTIRCSFEMAEWIGLVVGIDTLFDLYIRNARILSQSIEDSVHVVFKFCTACTDSVHVFREAGILTHKHFALISNDVRINHEIIINMKM